MCAHESQLEPPPELLWGDGAVVRSVLAGSASRVRVGTLECVLLCGRLWACAVPGLDSCGGAFSFAVIVGPLSVFGFLYFLSGVRGTSTRVVPVVMVVMEWTMWPQIPILERKADERWGDVVAYRHYKARTSLLVPLPPGLFGRKVASK